MGQNLPTYNFYFVLRNNTKTNSKIFTAVVISVYISKLFVLILLHRGRKI